MSIKRPIIPFQSKYIDIDGYNIHYLDEGKGEVILVSHGIPEWSWLYADLIRELSKSYRCIVPDHLGFGLSDKVQKVDLGPAAHARRLLTLAKALHLSKINLYVHDLGGPIGIGALILDSGIFKSLTISNSFCWNLEGSKAGNALKMMQGSLGRWLYLKYGFSVKFMAKSAIADKHNFKKNRDVFMYPHQTSTDREANYRLMLEMLYSGKYYDGALAKLKTIDMPMQVIWGMKDKFFDAATYLRRWQTELPKLSTHEITESGHFPQIEATGKLATFISAFIQHSK